MYIPDVHTKQMDVYGEIICPECEPGPPIALRQPIQIWSKGTLKKHCVNTLEDQAGVDNWEEHACSAVALQASGRESDSCTTCL